jgi:hypothetical protein
MTANHLTLIKTEKDDLNAFFQFQLDKEANYLAAFTEMKMLTTKNIHERLNTKTFLSEQKAKQLFKAIEERGLIIPGKQKSNFAMKLCKLPKKILVQKIIGAKKL